MDYLLETGLIEYTGFDSSSTAANSIEGVKSIRITLEGKYEVNTALLHPNKPPQHFPAFNIIDIYNKCGRNVTNVTNNTNFDEEITSRPPV